MSLNLLETERYQIYHSLALEAGSALQYATWGGQVPDAEAAEIFRRVAAIELRHYHSLSERWNALAGSPLASLDQIANTANDLLAGRKLPSPAAEPFLNRNLASFWYLWSALALEEAASFSYERFGSFSDQNQKDLFYGLQKDEHTHISYFQSRLEALSQELGVAGAPPPAYRAPIAPPS